MRCQNCKCAYLHGLCDWIVQQILKYQFFVTVWQWGTSFTCKDWCPWCISKQCTVKALIKALLKNNYDPQRRLVWSEKLILTLRGAMFREAPLNQGATVKPLKSELQRPSYNWLRWRYRKWTRLEVRLVIDCCCCCEQSRNYSTTAKELVVLKAAQAGTYEPPRREGAFN